MKETKTNHKNREGEVPVIGVSRHRLGIDGEGVTTLVGFHGCPLRCLYCLNPHALGPDDKFKRYTPESLLRLVEVDDLYFRSTGGGICFGGGEPLMRTDFIVKFKEICNPEWKITVETSLQGTYDDIRRLAPIVDEWIVDVKASAPNQYERYTGGKAWRLVENLKTLAELAKKGKESITLRVPVVPGFTSREEAMGTAENYRKEGFLNVEVFEYETEPSNPETARNRMNEHGKDKCELLKKIRRELALKNGIEMPERECDHEGGCSGTCQMCDYELSQLSSKLNGMKKPKLDVSKETINNLQYFIGADEDSGADMGDITRLQGADVAHGYMLPPPPPQSPRRKRIFKECAVAGISFHIDAKDDIWYELEEGQEVVLVRDRRNKYDRNAVAIAFKDDYDGDPQNFDFDFILGYVPREENHDIAMLLDMGWQDLFYTELSTVKRYGPLNDRLRISIYVCENEEQKKDVMRLCPVTMSEWTSTIREIEERGVTHFRWGGFPPWEMNLPKVGTQIVLALDWGNSVVMMLTRVIAKGDDCIPFVEDPEMVNAVDDCCSFILANTYGPAIVDGSEAQFLASMMEVYDYSKELTFEESESLKKMFHKMIWKFNADNIDSDPSLDDDLPLPKKP